MTTDAEELGLITCQIVQVWSGTKVLSCRRRDRIQCVTTKSVGGSGDAGGESSDVKNWVQYSASVHSIPNLFLN